MRSEELLPSKNTSLGFYCKSQKDSCYTNLDTSDPWKPQRAFFFSFPLHSRRNPVELQRAFLNEAAGTAFRPRYKAAKHGNDCVPRSDLVHKAQWRAGQTGWTNQRSFWLCIPPLTAISGRCSRKDGKDQRCWERSKGHGAIWQRSYFGI